MLESTDYTTCYKVQRKALHDIHDNYYIDYYIDFVCSRRGVPTYGFIIVDNNTLQYDLEIIQNSSTKSLDFKLYAVNAEWIITQTKKPVNIIYKKVVFDI